MNPNIFLQMVGLIFDQLLYDLSNSLLHSQIQRLDYNQEEVDKV